ncbi:MAG TPA: DUF4389 domain-containing protein [Candidatus Nanoarchaeia archaeon]|nr:DUF4389 domain-containing protein [Candidatus Nanoarchaeia archaeon]
MPERKEAWMRIIVAIVSGIILGLWKTLVVVLSLFHWVYVIFSGNRSRGIAEFCNMWTTQAYRFIRYMTFATNSRPFPFSELGNEMHPVEFKTKKK